MRRNRQRRTWRQRMVLALSGSLVLALLVTAGGLAYAYSKYSRLARVQLGSVLTDRTTSSEPQNILLVGVDSAANLATDDPTRAGREDAGGLRSDSMMILRVDPSSEEAHLLSIPRDLWVPLASGGRQRINTAIQIGGPSELIATIDGALGIPVHHYVQVDFAAFRELVDVIGGVKMWFEHPARDRKSLLDIPEAGCVTLDGEQALHYVRSRTFQQQIDGRWRTDPTGDHGRMSRQQDFIVRALRRAVDRGARNPVTLDRLIDAGLEAVAVDDLWTAEDIASLGARFRSFDPDEMIKHSLPVVDDMVGGAEVLRLVDSAAQPILDLFRGTNTAEATPEGVRVKVLNGTGVSGQAAVVSSELVAAGFTSADTGEADTFDHARTIVRHGPGGEGAADLVARHLVAGADLELTEDALDADVVVVTGRDYAGLLDQPRPSTSTTATTTGGGVPTTTASTSSTSTTSTSVIGDVPQAPPGADC